MEDRDQHIDEFSDDELDDVDLELVGLMPSTPSQTSHRKVNEELWTTTCGRTMCFSCTMATTLTTTFIVGMMALMWAFQNGDSGEMPTTSTSLGFRRGALRRFNNNLPVLYECPAKPILHDANWEDDSELDYLASDSQPIARSIGAVAASEDDELNNTTDINTTEFLQTYRTHAFDGWGSTYEESKRNLAPLYEQYIIPQIKSGFQIYESACGIGLKLYMTLEFLHELTNVTDVRVYGNEYIDVNAQRADTILDILLAQEGYSEGKLSKGTICTGDSTDMPFVPSSSFDMVFSGYVSPLFDPITMTSHHRKQLCNAAEDDWKSQTILSVEQKMQEDWYHKWMVEMLRIAKPGASIFLQQISRPKCEVPSDWGGIDPAFWTKAIEERGWAIDPSSVVIMSYGKEERYHVIMQTLE